MSKYIVPMEIPKHCSNCPFGHLHYHHPFWSNEARIDPIDKKLNKPDTYGCVCNMVQIERGGRMNIWSIVVIVLYTLNLGVVLAKHGQQREGKHNFWMSLLTFGVIMFCLYMGGFFK